MNALPRRVLLLGGTSEIGLATVRQLRIAADAEIVLAGRDMTALQSAARALPANWTTKTDVFDARDTDAVGSVVRRAFAAGPVDLVLVAFGVLGDQQASERDPANVDDVLAINVVAQIRAMLESARLMREQKSGTLVVFSSIAAVRPRRANFVYGATKAAVDTCARGLADALHGTGVHVLLIRPGFVIGRMTRGMQPAVMSSTPGDVGVATAAAIASGAAVVWVPSRLRLLAAVMRIVPRPLWRRMPR